VLDVTVAKPAELVENRVTILIQKAV